MPLWHHWAFWYIQDGVQDGSQLSVETLCDVECFKPIIFLKLFAVWLESNWRHLTWKVFPETGKAQEFAFKGLFLLILVFETSCLSIQVLPLLHHSEFDIFEMVYRMVADFYYRAACNADTVERWEFCLSVCLTNACIVTKRNLSRFLYHTKDHLA